MSEPAVGRFISLEGGEGVGKSTQLVALAEFLRGRGRDVVTTREPGGSAGAELIRGLLLGGADDRWGARAEALLFAAARADHVDQLIRPAIEAGLWVLSDRFVDSSLAYQGGAGGLGIEAVRAINGFGVGPCFPDRTLILTLAEGRRAGAGAGRRGGRPDRRTVGGLSSVGGGGVPRDCRGRAWAGAAGRCVGFARGRHRAARRRTGRPAVIFGQDRAVMRFVEAKGSGSFHHAWLLAGPRGVGKARFAREAATRVLAEAAGPAPGGAGLETPVDHPMARLVEANSHPDFRWIERELNDKGDALKRNISAKQVRKLGELFGSTPSMSPWRVVVIDSADDLEREGANALLKMLEEPPPNCLFLLVAHAPGRLLPTIRSRCSRLDFHALDDEAMTSVIERALPGAGSAEVARLVALGDGSAGRAMGYAALDLGPVEADALAILREGDPTNARRSKLAQGMGGKAGAERYAAFLQLIPSLIAREARTLDGPRRLRALDAYASARETAAVAQRLSLDPAATVFQLGTILASVP